MNDPTPAPLQFEKAEFHAPVAAAECSVCKRPIVGSYFTLNTGAVCATCKELVAATFTGGSGAVRLLKASVFGVGAGIAGAAIWFFVAYFLHLNIGLVAILIGYMVGYSVRKGSENRGGLTYQILAVLLTYAAICWSTIPEIVMARGDTSVLLASLVAFFVSFAMPFLGAFSGITVLIIAFGLWEAWRRNKALVLNFEGPFAMPLPSAEPAVANG